MSNPTNQLNNKILHMSLKLLLGVDQFVSWLVS